MKYFTKQILEAINRGIQLALDDYEDNEPNSSLSQHNDVIDSDDVIKQKYDLMKEVVDLGLPSGTLWCKYNLDVNPIQLTKPEDWYGKYYAWGELEGNKTNEDGEIYFGWDNYKYGNNYNKLIKYCDTSEYGLNGFTDNLTELLPEDDAAYQNKKLYNYKFHIPTAEQLEELENCTKSYWINNYDPNKSIHNPKDDKGIKGLNGRVFEGTNGNQLFIPAAGYRYGSDIYDDGSYCCLWSSSLYLGDPNYAYPLRFDFTYFFMDNNDRCCGCSVRPVINL